MELTLSEKLIDGINLHTTEPLVDEIYFYCTSIFVAKQFTFNIFAHDNNCLYMITLMIDEIEYVVIYENLHDFTD